MAVWSTFWFAVSMAGAATAFSVAAGLWLAWRLESGQFPGRQAASAALRVLSRLPAPALTYCLLSAAVRGWPPSAAGLFAAGVLSGLPLFTGSTRAALSAQDPIYAGAARTLGASGARVFLLAEALPVWRELLRHAVLTFFGILAELAAACWLVGALR